jgi:hypothetical protein
MAYYIQQLPQFPAPAREGQNTSHEPWVHDDVVLRLTAVSQHAWHEQLYHGEDFAGRDDCMPARMPVSPVSLVSSVTLPNAGSITPVAKQKPAHPSFVRRMLAMACATAIVSTASALGLWAAHSTSPKSWPSAKQSRIDSLLSHR